MASNPPHALRLTFDYRGTQVTLAGSERIAMVVPAPIDAPPEPGQTGYWFALLDAQGRVIYHRPLHRPIKMDIEAFSPGSDPSITRVPVAAREGRFTVLVPDVADAQTFQMQGPRDPEHPDEPAGELLRLDVDALRRAKPPQGSAGTPQGPAGTPQGPAGTPRRTGG